jgi:hypothetical protein
MHVQESYICQTGMLPILRWSGDSSIIPSTQDVLYPNCLSLSVGLCQSVAEEDYNELGEEGNYHHCYCHYVLVHAWLTNTWQIGRSIQSEE